MSNLASIVEQLREERSRIDTAIAALTTINGGSARRSSNTAHPRKRRTMSAAARAKIAAAQRARWAKQKAGKKSAA